MVKGKSELGVTLRNRHDRTESHSDEVSPSIHRLFHDAGRFIRVVRHHNAVARRNMEVAEQVALAERRDEQLLGIPPIGVAVEDPVRRTADLVLALGVHDVIATVRPVITRAGSAIACPFERHGEVVFVIHALNATLRRR